MSGPSVTMRAQITAMVASLHTRTVALGARACVAAAGPGSSGIQALLDVSGASSSILDAEVPYAREAFDAYTGYASDDLQYSSSASAHHLAEAALTRAVYFMAKSCRTVHELANIDAVGVGCAGAIATVRPRKGKHACHTVVIRTCAQAVSRRCSSVTFCKGLRDRAGEENVAGALLVASLVDSLKAAQDPWSIVREQLHSEKTGATSVRIVQSVDGVESGFDSTCGTPKDEEECLILSDAEPLDPLHSLLHAPCIPSRGGIPPVTHVLYVPFHHDGHGEPNSEHGVRVLQNAPLHVVGTAGGRNRRADGSTLPPPVLLLPGSFNPFHIGHQGMAVAAAEMLQAHEERQYSVVFELSAANVDKPALSEETVLSRVSQLLRPSKTTNAGVSGAKWPIVVTKAPRFTEKAALFPGCAFVVGFDTACRLLHPKYYDNDAQTMHASVLEMVRSGTRFIVAGRVAAAAPVVLPDYYNGDKSAPPSMSAETFLTYSLHLLPRVHPSLRLAFLELPEAQFREDISSSQIRKESAVSSAVQSHVC